MATRTRGAGTDARAETRTRGGRAGLAPLSRDAIVRAALALADREGLDAVSMRNVASELDVGFMRFYGHVESKEQLLELMVDAVYGELAPPADESWRAALRSVAQELRAAAARHAWFIGLLGGRPNLGPNAFAYNEACFEALGFADIDDSLEALRIMKSYAIGAIQSEASDLGSGENRETWQRSMWPYVQQMLATGKYPNIARVVREAKHPEDVFERGLERVLAGIAAGLRPRVKR